MAAWLKQKRCACLDQNNRRGKIHKAVPAYVGSLAVTGQHADCCMHVRCRDCGGNGCMCRAVCF
eukprot:811534-Pelagomonas_calceolata.AAC.2